MNVITTYITNYYSIVTLKTISGVF